MQIKGPGGLGVLDIKTQNEALILKYLHKFLNKVDTPCVSLIWEKYYNNGRLPDDNKKGSFWWRDVLKLLEKFRGMARVMLKDGKSCRFWDDLWSDEILSHRFPELYSAKKKKISTAAGLSTTQIQDLFLIYRFLKRPFYRWGSFKKQWTTW